MGADEQVHCLPQGLTPTRPPKGQALLTAPAGPAKPRSAYCPGRHAPRPHHGSSLGLPGGPRPPSSAIGENSLEISDICS